MLCEVRGGSYPHSGARRMCEVNQTEVDEASKSLVESLVGSYQDMPLLIPIKELNDLDSYREIGRSKEML